MRGLRQPAIRISLGAFLSADVEEKTGRFLVIIPKFGPINRVCVFGTVTQKITGVNNYVGVLLDDGSGECWVKCWDGTLAEINAWEQVEIVGRIRIQMKEDNYDVYIQSETVNRNIDPNWEIMHRLDVLKTNLSPPTEFGAFGDFQLASEFSYPQEDIEAKEIYKDSNDKVSEEEQKEDIFIQKLENLIQQHEEEKGVSYDKLRQSIDREEEIKLDDALFKLLVDGKIYEPTPARYKTLK
ncbi:MAG: hypothetical protein ACFFCQ_05450 [Promethearchaeota archaeon]